MNITLREAAKAFGVTPTGLRKRIGRGKITWPPESIEAMKAEWEQNRDLNHVKPAPRAETDIPQSPHYPRQQTSTDAPSAVRPTLPPGVPSQAVSSAREAALRVEERAFRVAQRKGILLDAGEVKASWAGMIITARNRLLLVPEQVSDAIAAEVDPIRCREIVAGAIHDALISLKDYKPIQR